jgi:hypothetical protein
MKVTDDSAGANSRLVILSASDKIKGLYEKNKEGH